MTSTSDCSHASVACINPYEFIRKYRCAACGLVMICACDRAFAERFLPHQLNRGADLHTALDVEVTLGFVSTVCNECRGLPAEACPKAEIYGRSSKIVRYYWRELYFETTRRFADWLDAQGGTSAVPRLSK